MRKLKILLCLIILYIHPVKAQDVYVSNKKDSTQASTIVVPFSFYLQSFGLAAAVDVASRGFIQEQATSTLVGLVSTNGSKYLYWEADNFQIPYVPRLFLSPNINIAHYGALDIYSGYNPSFPKETAGNNESNKNNFYNIKSNKIEAEFMFRFLLPTGYGKEHIINEITLKNGLPTSGYTSFSEGLNPVKNGRTFIESSLFFQDQNMKFPFGDVHKRYIGYNIGVNCENIDFKESPTKGIQVFYKYWQGLDILRTTNPWSMQEASLAKYFSIPSTYLRQQVIAVNVWTKNVDSWNTFTEKDKNKQPIYHRPSPFSGASLGGRYRFRSYPEARFTDAASLLYTLEYRIIPNWNPLKNWGFLRKMNVNIDWIQFVAFIESGRVAPNWDIKKLNTNMQYDYGLGIRFFANEMLIRVDGGFSKEDSQVQMFIGQSF
jgi:hypothetical protein